MVSPTPDASREPVRANRINPTPVPKETLPEPEEPSFDDVLEKTALAMARDFWESDGKK